MKKILLTIFMLFACTCIFAQQVKISKSDCSVTVNGKTFPLSGKVKIVESFPDIKVQVVESFPDVEIKLTEVLGPDAANGSLWSRFQMLKFSLSTRFPTSKLSS